MGSGRKTILTKELQEAICANLRECFYLSTATEAVGINYQTTRAWIDRGRKHEKEIHIDGDECTDLCTEGEVANRTFAIAVKTAQAIYTQTNMQDIAKSRPKNWMAGAWLLERTQPDKFGQRTRTELSVSGTIKHQHSISIDQRQKVLKAAADSLMIDTSQEDDVIEAEIVPEKG